MCLQPDRVKYYRGGSGSLISDFSQRAVFLLLLQPHFITVPLNILCLFLFLFQSTLIVLQPEYLENHISCPCLKPNYQLFSVFECAV